MKKAKKIRRKTPVSQSTFKKGTAAISNNSKLSIIKMSKVTHEFIK
jgi:hypothetical protein